MRRTILFVFSLSLLVCLGFGLSEWKKGSVVKAESNSEETNSLTSLNQKAVNARQGEKADTKELVAGMIEVSGFESELRGFTETTIEDRVGKAEDLYRQGQSKGIPEANIVRTVNGLAKKFDLPEYVRTNSYEVRKLRVDLLPIFPQIITSKAQDNQTAFVEKQTASVGTQIDSQLSPAEAFFVLSMMLQQKLANPEYQLTQKERVNRWNESHDHRPKKEKTFSRPLQNRSGEIKDALQRAAESTSMSDALHLSDITLNTLGIE